jgi:hypothetical protein
MALRFDKRTHWYARRNDFGQRMRFCTEATTGVFVPDNTKAEAKRLVDCSKCITRMKKVAV